MPDAVRPLGDAEVLLLIPAAARTRHPARDLAILSLAVDAGLTRSEISGLRSVDLEDADVLHVAGLRPRAIRLGQACLNALEPLRGQRDGGGLLPVTDRVVHEQLLRIGELAGIGEWVTCRHTRRTFISSIAEAGHDIPVLLRLAGHAPGRVKPATIDEALEAQFTAGWRSPLDTMLDRVCPASDEVRRAA